MVEEQLFNVIESEVALGWDFFGSQKLREKSKKKSQNQTNGIFRAKTQNGEKSQTCFPWDGINHEKANSNILC